MNRKTPRSKEGKALARDWICEKKEKSLFFHVPNTDKWIPNGWSIYEQTDIYIGATPTSRIAAGVKEGVTLVLN